MQLKNKEKHIKLADFDFPLFTSQLDEVNLKEWEEQAGRPLGLPGHTAC